MTQHMHMHIAIKATTDAVWQALTDEAITPACYVGFSAEFQLAPGAAYRYTAGGGDMITGTFLDVEPGARLVTTFNGQWDPAVAELPEAIATWRKLVNDVLSWVNDDEPNVVAPMPFAAPATQIDVPSLLAALRMLLPPANVLDAVEVSTVPSPPTRATVTAFEEDTEAVPIALSYPADNRKRPSADWESWPSDKAVPLFAY